jgi:hypothetical protein
LHVQPRVREKAIEFQESAPLPVGDRTVIESTTTGTGFVYCLGEMKSLLAKLLRKQKKKKNCKRRNKEADCRRELDESGVSCTDKEKKQRNHNFGSSTLGSCAMESTKAGRQMQQNK